MASGEIELGAFGNSANRTSIANGRRTGEVPTSSVADSVGTRFGKVQLLRMSPKRSVSAVGLHLDNNIT